MNTELIEKYDMLPRGAKVLAAVSGGADSVCLLHWLLSMREERGIELFAAHFEHGIRGAESERDARFVEELCEKWGIVCRVEHGDALSCAAENSLGTEEAARLLRYEFLERSARELGCTRIATAHNAGDNAETVIFNLVRGSGGIRGIPPVRGIFVRPLLETGREEIEKYLFDNGLPHVEDSTNALDEYSRNRLRHNVLPLLREINPALDRAIMRACELQRADEEYLSAQAARFIAEEKDENGSLPSEKLSSLPESVKTRVIRQLSPQSLSYENVGAVCAILKSSELKYADVPGARIRCEQGRIYFKDSQVEPLEECALKIGERTEIAAAGIALTAEYTVYGGEVYEKLKSYIFKKENICGRIICTGRKPGDRLRPAGRNCTKTLKALFTEAGYTQQQRESAVVLRDEKGILAVCGLTRAERGAVKPGDEILRIDIEKLRG